MPISTCLLSECYENSTAFDIRLDLLAYFQELDFPSIFKALEVAEVGDGSGFPGGPQLDLTSLVSIPLECDDYEYQATTFGEWIDAFNTVESNDLTTIGYSP